MTTDASSALPLPDVSNTPLSDIQSLAGRVAVVTGGAWGLGRATASRLSEAGATVLIGDLDIEAAEKAASELSADGRTVSAMYLDAGDTASIAALADHAVATYGAIDIWVNNAGVPSFVPAMDLDYDAYDKVLAINLRGTFAGAKEAAKRMIDANRRGVIVNVASLAGILGISPGQAAYCSSKHGVVGLTKQLAIEFGTMGIRVMGVAPGFCLTEKTAYMADMTPEQLAMIPIPGVDGSRLGRVGVSDDIARAILFCASDMSMFMTGNTLVVDGGTSA